MDPRVAAQLRMEARAKDISLSDGNDVLLTSFCHMCTSMVFPSWQGGHHLNLHVCEFRCKFVLWLLARCLDFEVISLTVRNSACTCGFGRQHRLYDRGSNENSSEGRRRWRIVGSIVSFVQKGQIQLGHEAFDLSAKVVPPHSYVKAADQVLPALFRAVGRLGEEDQACARSPDRSTLDSTGGSLSATQSRVLPSASVPYFTKSRRSSRRPLRAATRDMVVLSPPGTTKASHDRRSVSVRTSMNLQSTSSLCWLFLLAATCCDALSSSWVCSLKAPCRASTPTVTVFGLPAMLDLVVRRRSSGVMGK